MASLNNSNALNTPAPVQNNLRRRPIRAATELVAKSVVNFIDFPGLKDSVRTAREIVGALKPNILQEPARNDLIKQNLIDHIDEILLCAQGDGTQVDPEYLEDLQRIKAAVVELKNKTYRTKLACQGDIGRELVKRKEEIIERTLLFNVEGSMCGRRAEARSAELEERFEHVFDVLHGELASVKLQLARQGCQMHLHQFAMFGNSVDLNLTFFFQHE